MTTHHAPDLWAIQLENFPDSVRVQHKELVCQWLCDKDGYVVSDPNLTVGVLSAVLQHPDGVFYTCLKGTAYGYRYGASGSEYYSFQKGGAT